MIHKLVCNGIIKEIGMPTGIGGHFWLPWFEVFKHKQSSIVVNIVDFYKIGSKKFDFHAEVIHVSYKMAIEGKFLFSLLLMATWNIFILFLLLNFLWKRKTPTHIGYVSKTDELFWLQKFSFATISKVPEVILLDDSG